MGSARTRAVAPATLAAALRIAIADGRAVLVTHAKRYAFDASYWHEGRRGSTKCKICAAGAVMAHRLDAGEDELCFPARFAISGWNKALCAIDDLRKGAWSAAWRAMHDARPQAFAERMRAALDAENPGNRTRLEAVGEFNSAGGYRAFLDAAETIVLPILERCEREALAEAARERANNAPA